VLAGVLVQANAIGACAAVVYAEVASHADPARLEAHQGRPVNLIPTSPRAPSLCESCAFARHVKGRHGQLYLLCRNDEIAAKYPRQPVTSCKGYEPAAE
jgi:hypothetical protein